MSDPALATFERLFGPEFGHGKSFDLAPLRAALLALDEPQNTLPPVIHVAGTNGKGSAIAFMRAIAEAAGLAVHAFTKPHLFALNERFVVTGKLASNGALNSAAERVHAVAPNLTQFDAQVAAALLLFSETPADLVLLETGMGGREDSTNVIAAPAVSVITPIGMDHQDALGDTLAEITAHKAGILKPGVPAIIARQHEVAAEIIEAHAASIGAPLLRQGVDWDVYPSPGGIVVQSIDRVLDLPTPKLYGPHQTGNAGLACVTLLTAMRDAISDAAFAEGMRAVRWPARLQPLTRGPLSAPIRARGGEVWVDAGHNAHAGKALAYAMREMHRERGGTVIAIVGLRARKDAKAIVDALSDGAHHIIAMPLSEAHAPLDDIAPIHAPSLEAAMQRAAQFPGPPRVLICGSFLLAAEALAAEGA